MLTNTLIWWTVLNDDEQSDIMSMNVESATPKNDIYIYIATYLHMSGVEQAHVCDNIRRKHEQISYNEDGLDM